MPPMNLPWAVFNRPIKPVALVLMNTMLILGWIAITDNGVLGESEWADLTGGVALSVAALFIISFVKLSQRGAELALVGAFFVWGVRFWTLILASGPEIFLHESVWLAGCWMLLAGGSWLLERSDPYIHGQKKRGAKWIRR